MENIQYPLPFNQRFHNIDLLCLKILVVQDK